MMSQPTGAFGNFGNSSPFNSTPIISTNPTGFNPSFGNNNGGFNPLQPNPTGFNPNFGAGMGGMLQPQPTGFGQSPFSNGFSSPPPPVPPLPTSNSSNMNSTNPANIFAQMKSGTFDNDSGPQDSNKYDALRTGPVMTQPTGWMNYGGR
jgi:hypothetical protein